ncbi:MAG TPA: NADPH-dependent FMN reductase [Pseudolabrys sp.]|nr:NADPH-dependent FMN reductase [Pseudolabrys sp.]
MSKKLILAISSSPSSSSRTAKVADYVLQGLNGDSLMTRHIQLRDMDPEALMLAKSGHVSVSRTVTAIEQADGLIIATPIFKASYSGLLKVFLDLLPQFALAGKAVLPIATGGSLGHLLALDYGLRPVLQSMGARHIVQSLFVPESEMRIVDDKLQIGEQTDVMLREAIHHFKLAVEATTEDRFLGHPRPVRTGS